MSRRQPPESNRDIRYIYDGDKWFRVEYSIQCEEAVILAGRCQGVKGHEGPHWSYDQVGCYCTSDDEGSSSTPPDHAKWVNPKEMFPKYHLHFTNTTEVTDPEEIARIESGRMVPGESREFPAEFAEKFRPYFLKKEDK